ncbi:MAG: hypothetical protein WBK45_05280 [Tepidanaerobacteraceae bacterium]|jgi:hypothetical protein
MSSKVFFTGVGSSGSSFGFDEPPPPPGPPGSSPESFFINSIINKKANENQGRVGFSSGKM